MKRNSIPSLPRGPAVVNFMSRFSHKRRTESAKKLFS